jgi:hypothetical protein
MDIEKLFLVYYSKSLNDKKKFRYVWTRIGQILQLDPRRLRPEDRFSFELAAVPEAEIDDELDELEEFFLEEIGFMGTYVDIKNIKTINDLVMSVCR